MRMPRLAPRISLSAAVVLALCAGRAEALTYPVLTANDSGPLSLRAAIQFANSHAGPDTIVFEIPGPGVRRILLSSPLPALTDPAGATIDGFTQPYSRPNTLANGDDAIRLVEINVPTFADAALDLRSDNNIVRGLIVTGHAIDAVRIWGTKFNSITGSFLANDFGQGVEMLAGASDNAVGGPAPGDRNVIGAVNGIGVLIRGVGSSRNRVEGNFIGVAPDGISPLPNIHGVAVGDGATDNTIGGTVAGAGNIISGNTAIGVAIEDEGTSGNRIQGNRIGTDASGALRLSNASGVQVGFDCDSNTVGGMEPGAPNVISGNRFQGVVIVLTANNRVIGNLIGTDASGVAPLGNGTFGVDLLSANGNSIEGNVVAYTRKGDPSTSYGDGNGIEVYNSIANRILDNSIYGNDGLGIGLLDSHNGQPSPVLSGAVVSLVNGKVVLQATQSSETAAGSNRVQFFLADNDPSGHGEGKSLLLDQPDLAAGAVSLKTAAFSPPTPVSPGDLLTATATTDYGTSEFSGNIPFIANQAPVARAGLNRVVPLGLVSLNSSGSFDFDGLPNGHTIRPGSFQWSQVSGPAAEIQNPTSSNPTVSIASPGVYVFSLVVSDGLDSSSAATVTISTLPHLTVTRAVVNDSGRAKTPLDFPLFVDGTLVSDGVGRFYMPGLHVVSESRSPGYAARIGGDCGADGSIQLVNGDVKTCTITNDDIPAIFLHGDDTNPLAAFFDVEPPLRSTPRTKDSGAMTFAGGNPWKEVGFWAASGPLVGLNGSIVGFNNLGVFLGLKTSDDEATRFDVRAEVYKTGALETAGEARCVIGVTRNPDKALRVIVPLAPFPSDTFSADDVVAVRVFVRIGTTATGAICGSHGTAAGVRLYFDAVKTSSGFQALFGP